MATEGTVGRTSDGKVYRYSDGLARRTPASLEECCCVAECLLCGASATPATWQVEFSGVTASGCQGDADGGSPDAVGGCHKFLSQNATYTIPATVCLRQLPPDINGCCWCAVIDCTVDFYDDEACAGDLLCTSTEKIYISLCIFLDGASTKATLLAYTLSDNSFCRRAGFFSNNDYSLSLFEDTITIGADACDDVHAFTNDITAAGINNIGFGGTATATPMACTPTSADCEMGDEGIPCPTDCEDCPDTITVVVSGCDFADGTYVCTRSGCSWSGTTGAFTCDVNCPDLGSGGAWRIWVEAGDGPSFYAVGYADCPTDVVSWEACTAFGTCASVTVS